MFEYPPKYSWWYYIRTTSSCKQRSRPPPSEKSCCTDPSLHDPAVFLLGKYFLWQKIFVRPADSPALGHSAWHHQWVRWGWHTGPCTAAGTGGSTRCCWSSRRAAPCPQGWRRSSSRPRILVRTPQLRLNPLTTCTTDVNEVRCGVLPLPPHPVDLVAPEGSHQSRKNIKWMNCVIFHVSWKWW